MQTPSSPSPAGTTATEPAVEATAQLNWEKLDALLAGHHADDSRPVMLASLAVYYQCVYQAFGRAADGVQAQQLAQRLAAQCCAEPSKRWVAAQIDQACALAWLDSHSVAAGLAQACSAAQLAVLDETLYQEANYLLAQPVLGHRGTLVRLARYLGLRRQVPTARQYQGSLLANWPKLLPGKHDPPLLLGLTDGLATELLMLIRAHKAGIQHANIEACVREGLRYLLAEKRPVDFAEHKYAIFPYQTHSSAHERMFSAELSWRRGDAGQSWLLYETQNMLQDKELANMAELVGLNTLLRISVETTEVTTAEFYQGAAGVAQLYAQLYRISEQPAYRTAYYFWLKRTQEMLHAELTTAATTLTDNAELLGGLVGTALVLLTATKALTAEWEDILV